MISYITLSLLLFVTFSNGADILAILPMPSYSHQIAYTHVWKELSLRGHKVTVVTTDPLKDPKLINLTEVDLSHTYNLLKNFGKSFQTEFTMWKFPNTLNVLQLQIVEEQLPHPEIQNLIHNKSHFDVVLVEFLYPEYLAFAEIYNCPKILFSSLDSTDVIHHLLGNPINPILYPELGATFYGSLSFGERLTSALYSWYAMYYYRHKAFSDKSRKVRKYFNITKTVSELLSDVDMMFINVNPVLQPIRALGPSTITIGGDREILSSTPVPQDIVEFLDGAVDGFIYFSLGSNIKSKDLDKDTQDAIIEALRELPYKVLWKFEADEPPNKPDNVKLIKWAPQQSILAHPNIKVFVTQGGLQSMEEAFYREVPFVVIPFFGDQDLNAKIIESKGIGVIVNRYPSVDKMELQTAIQEVANNPKYKNAIKQLKHWALDSPMTGLEKAIWWTEYVIRNKGAKHLRNPTADIPFYQHYLLDVISFLILTIIVALTSLYLLLKLMFRYIKLFIIRITDFSNLSLKKLQ